MYAIKVLGLNSNTEIGTDIIPIGYAIDYIALSETEGNDAGDVSIGTSALGNNVVNAQSISANSLIPCAIGSDFWSLVATQKLYISSSDWGTGIVTVHLVIKKILS
jgi:hypothetical protein